MIRKLPATVLLALIASGCATTPADPVSATGKQSVVDQQYVGAVNRQARRMGTRVVWINPPREKDRRKRED